MNALNARISALTVPKVLIVGSTLSAAFAQALHSLVKAARDTVSGSVLILANEDQVEDLPEQLANAGGKVESVSSEFELLQGDWIQIAPFGQFPHSAGLQYFDASDAQRLVDAFASLLGKLKRRFGGLPWYEGHPDTSPREFPNKRAYGWIDQLEVRSDGLYGHVKWTKAGQELVAEGHYKFFSPVWRVDAAQVAGKRVLRPTELISVGFTNMPNMPVLPLSNEQPQPNDNKIENEDMTLPPQALTMLGFAEDATPSPDEITTAVQALVDRCASAANAQTQIEEAQTALANEQSTHETALANLRSELETAQGEALANARREAEERFNSERHERIELLVATGITQGKILPADADKWRTDLTSNFDEKSTELANARQVLKTSGAITANLGESQSALENGGKPGDQLRQLANKISDEEGIKYSPAWAKAKRQRPDLVDAMKKPGSK
jgi:phage I-like protein